MSNEPLAPSKPPPEVVLVINAGLDFLEFEIYRMAREHRMLCKGIAEQIGQSSARLRYLRYDDRELTAKEPIPDVKAAVRVLALRMCSQDFGVLASMDELEAIGHRVVHGGEHFTGATLITEEVKQGIANCASLAPLHNPANLAGIEACEEVFPGKPNVAVFDTAFHQSMPPASYLYAIPYDYYERFEVRKYGFHGCSHQYVAEATARLLKRKLTDLNLITCHLGKGCSITAIAKGRVLDTSMGMTPLPGLVMGTRCGDIDPAVVLFLARQGMSVDELDDLLNKKSGLLGIAGNRGDMREVIAAATQNEQAAQAIWMFVQRVASYIGSYYALLGGADAVVFTGGIGENSPYIRSRIISQLGVLGCHLDETTNYVVGKPEIISDDRSTMKAVVMPTNEELMIARETARVLAERAAAAEQGAA